jgi:hypothetical protein
MFKTLAISAAVVTPLVIGGLTLDGLRHLTRVTSGDKIAKYEHPRKAVLVIDLLQAYTRISRSKFITWDADVGTVHLPTFFFPSVENRFFCRSSYDEPSFHK